MAGLFGFFWLLDAGLTGWDIVRGLCRDAGEWLSTDSFGHHLTGCRIVEYATREQAQQAVNTLSNQNLMGRLVYVREVISLCSHSVGRIVTSLLRENITPH